MGALQYTGEIGNIMKLSKRQISRISHQLHKICEEEVEENGI